jgi:flagellar motor switch protein FliM
MAADEEPPVDQDALADAWADEAGGDSGADSNASADDDDFGAVAAEGEGDRALNQDEIDSLLGFDDEESDEPESGLHALVNSSLVSYERLPMLEVVFDRLVRSLSTSLRGLTSDNVEVSLENIRSVRYGDYLNSIPLPAMISVFRAEEWDAQGILTVDSALIYSVVDVLLGGRKAMTSMRAEGRPYTTIERNLVTRMVNVVLSDMSDAFAPLSPIQFRAKSLETNPRFAAIVRPSNAAVLIELRVEMEERGGRIEIVIPYGTLEPIRELLLQMFLGEKFGRDQIWETHLAHELRSTSVKVEAVLDEVVMPLSEVLGWKPGSQITLNATPESPVHINSSGVPLFEGQMGRKNDRVAIRVEDRARPKEA